MRLRAAAVMLISCGLASCAGGGGYKAVDNMAKLDVSFADPAWNGSVIPAGQQCANFGGTGASPALLVKNIPPGTTDVIVEFNDRDFQPLSFDGGHGKIRVPVAAGRTEVTVPSVPGEKTSLPTGVLKEAGHRASFSPGTVYPPPCSGGRGHLYFADVKAVTRPPAPSEPGKLLAAGRITLGRY